MNWLTGFLTSNIGRKLVMALTGLFLVSFLFVHLAGNLLLLRNDGGEAFNVYSHFMSTAGIIRVLEIVLLLGFLIHIYTSVVLTRKNAKARPTGYVAPNNSPGVSWFSKNMGITGSVILVFLLIHLRTFYWEYHNGAVREVYYKQTTIQGDAQKEIVLVNETNRAEFPSMNVLKDMTLIAVDAFKNPLYIIGYVIAFAILGMHLSHGFASAFRTLGLEHKKYTPLVFYLGQLISIGVPLGFAIIPIIMYFN